MELCINCKERPVYIRKSGLCKKCYNHRYRNSGIKGKNNVQFNSEISFIRNYFNHNEWLYQPATFNMNGISYRPDFYDRKRNVFIEVAGTRQAYHANEHKYQLFNDLFPNIILEIRTVDGELLDLEQWGQVWPKNEKK